MLSNKPLRRTLIDNSKEGYNMTEVLQRCLDDEYITSVEIATGFWDLRGTKLLFDQLKSFLSRPDAKLRLLIGKDPYLYRSDLDSLQDKNYKKQEEGLLVEMNDFEANEEYVDVVNFIVDNLNAKEKKFEIRVYKPEEDEKKQFLHSKCYIFRGVDDEPRDVAYGIIGSTNFTKQGMEGNSELNILEVEATNIVQINTHVKDKTHLQWFEEKWNEGKDWNKEFLLQVKNSKMAPKVRNLEPVFTDEPEFENTTLTPYELYIKLLQYNFGDIVDANTTRRVESYLPSFYKAYQFQTDAVTQCYNIMQKYKGFMLADVVGLGKTVVGAMIIKHFLSVPDIDDRPRKVLIVTPPAIKKGWTDTIADFDKDREDKISPYVDLITTGSISNLFENDEDSDLEDSGDFEDAVPNEEYGLILIDESHKFRNNSTSMYKELDALIANSAIQPYVGLLSATPQNNRPDDIRNQIYLFCRTHTASDFEGAARNLEGFFADLKLRYKSLKDMEPEERKNELSAISKELRDNVLDKILVRRTRTDVRGYKDAEGNPVLKFPKVAPPHKMVPTYSDELKKLFGETMNAIMFEDGTDNGLGYYRYRAIQYLNSAEKKDRYRGKGSLDTDRVANQLANIMKLLLVKRLESSLYAFRKSLTKLYDDTCIMLDMLDKQTVFICPADQIDVTKEFADTTKTWEERANTIRQKIADLTQKGKNPKGSNAEYTADDFSPEFKEKLIHDRDLLKRLCTQWEGVKDPKHKVFRRELRQLLPESEPDKKLVIFTESADTLEDIKQLVEEEDFKPLCITADNRNKKHQEIQENFDANYGKKEGEVQKNDYQIIISTDVLAEGINLHRAYTIINYDTPWNSTKLMQRIGRVNRIGSVADEVQVYNFLPSDPGDSIINLFNRAYTKLQSFHSTFGEDAQVYTDDEEVNHYEVTEHDLEEQESPLMKYLFELREYKQQHPLRYDAIYKKEDNLELAVESNVKESLFVVRNNQTKGMCIASDTDGKREVLSTEEMYKRFKLDINATAVELSDGTDNLKRRAIRTFNREFSSISLQRAKSKQNDARNIIVAITDKYRGQLTDSIVDLLSQARELVDRGNVDICNSIKSIGKHLNIENPELFPLSIDEVREYIQSKLQNLDLRLQDEFGKGEVYIALYKI